MINKKIILSVLTIGLLACIASAGTWAYFQDTVTSTGNTITTATLTSWYQLGTGSWVPFSGDTGNSFGPFTFSYAVPGDTDKVVQAISIKNTGNTAATVAAKITTTGTVPNVPGLTISVGNQAIYSGGSFTTNPVTLGITSGTNPVDATIKYTYTDSGSQNAYEGQAIVFDMDISVKANPN